jgi:hypothetical protein
MKEIDQESLIQAINQVAATAAGKILFASLKDVCMWDETILASDCPATSHFYAVQRGLYGRFRKHIKVEFLKEIEFNYSFRRKNDGDNSSGNNTGNSRFRRGGKSAATSV